MDQEFTNKMKQSLLDLKKELLATLSDANAEFKKIADTMESKDDVDIASDDIDRKMLASIGQTDYNKLKMIDGALTRIEQGKYGLCLKCGKEIPKSRLEAIPYAFLCIECKSADEKRHR